MALIDYVDNVDIEGKLIMVRSFVVARVAVITTHGVVEMTWNRGIGIDS